MIKHLLLIGLIFSEVGAKGMRGPPQKGVLIRGPSHQEVFSHRLNFLYGVVVAPIHQLSAPEQPETKIKVQGCRLRPVQEVCFRGHCKESL